MELSPAALATSAARFRKDLVPIPIHGLGSALNYFTLRTGIRSSETVGELAGEIEIGPYDPYRKDTGKLSVTGRKLDVFLGNVVKEFDPNSVFQSIFGNSITKGEGLKNVPITLQILSFLAAKIGRGLRLHLFDAVRNDKGTKTTDLFNGFDTITAAEITAGNIAAAKGNLYEFSEAITKENAVDMITAFCRAASDELLEQEDGDDANMVLNLYCPRNIVYDYRDDYKATTGSSPIYDKFNQTVVEGFGNIRLVPFAGKTGSDFLQLSTKQNMLLGTDLMNDLETMTVEKFAPFILSFIATMVFGAQFESISREKLLVGKLYKKTVVTPPTSEGGQGNSPGNLGQGGESVDNKE